jgi:hypothetical protein
MKPIRDREIINKHLRPVADTAFPDKKDAIHKISLS